MNALDPGHGAETNAYRFNAKRWDAQSGTYDMGFRDYNPGLNPFTTRDMYNGALADMSLGSDPYTGNRYAFGGGNPSSSVELDGHLFGCDICDKVIDKVGDALKGGTKTVARSPKGILTAVDVFLDGIGWNTPTAPNGFESDPGDEPDYGKGLLVKPDYGKGLLVKPDSKKEWQPGDAQYPFVEEDCGKGQSMVYYHPLDGAGRAQGVDACLSPGGFNYTNDKGNDAFPGVDSEIWGTRTELPPPFGTDRRNLVPLYVSANSPIMSKFENEMAARVKGGDTIWYSVRAHYDGDNPLPTGLSIYWASKTTGDSGAFPVANEP